MRTTELDAACDDVVEKTERESCARSTSDEQHALVLPEVHTGATVGTVDHDLDGNTGLLVLLHTQTFLLRERVLVDGTGPVTYDPRSEGDAVSGNT